MKGINRAFRSDSWKPALTDRSCGVRSCVAGAILLLVACDDRRESSANAVVGREEKVLHVYNWADYIGESTIADFEAKTGIEVVYDVYDSSEVLETKMMTGRSGYDVVVPSGSRIPTLIQAGALQKLDKSKLRNLVNMDPQAMRIFATYDPDNAYAVPYSIGTTGIGYNPDMVEKALGTRIVDSLAAVLDPAIASKLARCGITMLDAPETMFSIAYIYLGLDANSERPEDRAAAEALLTRVEPYVRYFHSSQYVNDLASGEVCVSIGWSGGVMQARSRGAQAEMPVEVVYVVPREGAPLWLDGMVIPADAPHPDNAHAFLDYVMEPEVTAEISNAIGQANGNAASVRFVSEALRSNPAIYPSQEVFHRLHLEKDWSPQAVREVTRAWTRIRTGQ
jgi:putrescine transport system substrate-binding protein